MMNSKNLVGVSPTVSMGALILAVSACAPSEDDTRPAEPEASSDQSTQPHAILRFRGSLQKSPGASARTGSPQQNSGDRSAAAPLEQAVRAAKSVHVARLSVGDDDFSGLMVFQTEDEFVAWRNGPMLEIAGQVGGGATITSARLVFPGRLPGSSGELAKLAGDVSITYKNADNESEGDADIDAVTVICGDGADCQPSN